MPTKLQPGICSQVCELDIIFNFEKVTTSPCNVCLNYTFTCILLPAYDCRHSTCWMNFWLAGKYRRAVRRTLSELLQPKTSCKRWGSKSTNPTRGPAWTRPCGCTTIAKINPLPSPGEPLKHQWEFFCTSVRLSGDETGLTCAWIPAIYREISKVPMESFLSCLREASRVSEGRITKLAIGLPEIKPHWWKFQLVV